MAPKPDGQVLVKRRCLGLGSVGDNQHEFLSTDPTNRICNACRELAAGVTREYRCVVTGSKRLT